MFEQLINELFLYASQEEQGRVNAIANTLKQLEKYIPADVTLAGVVTGWIVASNVQKSDEGAVLARRETCSELAKRSGLTPLITKFLDEAKACWTAWAGTFEKLSADSKDPRQKTMAATFRRELKEMEEFEPEYIKGSEVTFSLEKYSKRVYNPHYAIFSYGEAWRNKWGDQFKHLFYLIEEGNKYFNVLTRSSLKIMHGEQRYDEWNSPSFGQPDISFLKNSEGETIGHCTSWSNYHESMPGWQKIGVKRPGYESGSPAYFIIQSPEGELFREL